MTDQSAEIRDLRERVDLLERMLVGTYALIVGVVLVLGLTLPFVTENAGTEDQIQWSVISTTLESFNSGEEFSGLDVAMMIGFIGLIIVTVLILAAALIPAAMRSLSNGLRIFGNVLVALGVVGAAAVMLMGVQTLRSSGNDFGWGGPVLLFGMLAVLPLLSSAARPLVSRAR